MILQESNGQLKTVARTEFKTEKELQTLVENNLEEIFGCRVVATEFSTGSLHSGRIDTLAISEDGNPVIIEYKKVENSNLVTQGLFYLDWLKDHKGDFQVAVQKKLGSVEIDWSNIRVLCIAPSFDRYSLHAVHHMGVGLELWQYHRYANGVLELEEIFRSSNIKKSERPRGASKDGTGRIDESTEYSIARHTKKGNENVKALFVEIDEFILSLNPSIVAVPQKVYIAYKFAKNIASVEVLSRKIKIWIPLTWRAGMPSIAKDVTNIGHYGTGNLELVIENSAHVEEAQALIKEAYLLAGGD